MDNHKRSYKMGHRRKQNAPGHMSDSRLAWCRVYFGQFVIWADFKKDEEDAYTDEVRDIKLLYPMPGRKPITWNLTALTEQELIAVKELFDVAFAMALPMVQQRDKEANDALSQGDDSNSRVYRPLPQLVYRSRSIGKHSKGVQHGPADDAGVLRDDLNPDDGVRDEVDPLAEQDEAVGSPEDDWTETD